MRGFIPSSYRDDLGLATRSPVRTGRRPTWRAGSACRREVRRRPDHARYRPEALEATFEVDARRTSRPAARLLGTTGSPHRTIAGDAAGHRSHGSLRGRIRSRSKDRCRTSGRGPFAPRRPADVEAADVAAGGHGMNLLTIRFSGPAQRGLLQPQVQVSRWRGRISVHTQSTATTSAGHRHSLRSLDPTQPPVSWAMVAGSVRAEVGPGRGAGVAAGRADVRGVRRPAGAAGVRAGGVGDGLRYELGR